LKEKVKLDLYGHFKTVRDDFIVLPVSNNVSLSSGADLVSAAKISTQANAGKVVTSAQL
jgi:hypothetical protein